MSRKQKPAHLSYKRGKSWPGLLLGALAGWALAQQAWVLSRLFKVDVQQNLANHFNPFITDLQEIKRRETDAFTIRHAVENGIERIVYTPKKRRFETPILMCHGMWHGAWCWERWQALFAKWGWESVAFSLPGHAGSPEQRPIRLCTLDYYLGFLRDEIERLPRLPVLMGHSMGGALAQWVFKYIRDDLPAAVLVAPWISHSALSDGLTRFLRLDPLGCLMMAWDWSFAPIIRTPQSAARALISSKAVVSPEALHAQLGPESALVAYQHNPPFWRPPADVKTPILWLAAEKDAVVGEIAQRRSAVYYKADYALIEDAAHNLMMEHNYRQTAEYIHKWLSKKCHSEGAAEESL